MPSAWRMMKVGDVFVIAGVVILFVLSVVFFWTGKAGETALIYAQAAEPVRVRLDEDSDFFVAGPLGNSRIRVVEGRIWVEEAPCPYQLCRKMGRVGRRGDIIVCVPNRLFIRIEGENGGLDAVTM